MRAAIVLVTPCGALRWGTVCCHRGLLFMAIVEDAFPSRSDGRKQPLRPYRGSYATSEADHEYRHLISHRVPAASIQNNAGCNSESRAFWSAPPSISAVVEPTEGTHLLCQYQSSAGYAGKK